MEWIEKPHTIGEILDLTFRIFKKYFKPLLLITLILVGPIYLIQVIGKIISGSSFFTDPNTQIQYFWQIPDSSMLNPDAADANSSELLFQGISGFLSVFIIPVAYAAIIISVEQIRRLNSVDIKTAIKRGFSRLSALLGGSIVYALLSAALIGTMVTIVVVFLSLTAGLDMLASDEINLSGLGIEFISAILLSIGGMAVIIYLLTRWSFYFPAIVFEKVSPGLGKSWKLTRRSFWRLVGLYLVILLLTIILSTVLQVIPTLLLGDSVLAYIINLLINLVILTFSTVALAVVYFDLRIRNDAADLKEILASYTEGDSDNQVIQ